MEQERWKQIDAVFEQLLEIEPGERAEALAQLCADDDELRCRVEALLAQQTPVAGQTLRELLLRAQTHATKRLAVIASGI